MFRQCTTPAIVQLSLVVLCTILFTSYKLGKVVGSARKATQPTLWVRRRSMCFHVSRFIFGWLATHSFTLFRTDINGTALFIQCVCVCVCDIKTNGRVWIIRLGLNLAFGVRVRLQPNSQHIYIGSYIQATPLSCSAAIGPSSNMSNLIIRLASMCYDMQANFYFLFHMSSFFECCALDDKENLITFARYDTKDCYCCSCCRCRCWNCCDLVWWVARLESAPKRKWVHTTWCLI